MINGNSGNKRTKWGEGNNKRMKLGESTLYFNTYGLLVLFCWAVFGFLSI